MQLATILNPLPPLPPLPAIALVKHETCNPFVWRWRRSELHMLLHTTTLSPAGKTLAENLDTCRDLDPNQTIIKPLESPVKPTGHIQILYGNISPEGCVGKITGKEGLAFEGPAKVYNSEEDMIAALSEDPQSMKVR